MGSVQAEGEAPDGPTPLMTKLTGGRDDKNWVTNKLPDLMGWRAWKVGGKYYLCFLTNLICALLTLLHPGLRLVGEYRGRQDTNSGKKLKNVFSSNEFDLHIYCVDIKTNPTLSMVAGTSTVMTAVSTITLEPRAT
jgi:hypothetical protein